MRITTVIKNITLLFLGAFFVLVAALVTTQVATAGKLQHPYVVWLMMIAAYIVLINVIYVLIQFNRFYQEYSANHNQITAASLVHFRKSTKSLLILSLSSILVLPFFYVAAQADDAPGLMLFGILLVAIPFAVTGIVKVLGDMMKNTIQ